MSFPCKAKPTNIYFLIPKISKFLILSIGNLVNFIWGKESVILMTMMPQAATWEF
jgi:hypothetical protein